MNRTLTSRAYGRDKRVVKDSLNEALREISKWPDWKVASMLDKDNDLDSRFWDAILSVRESNA